MNKEKIIIFALVAFVAYHLFIKEGFEVQKTRCSSYPIPQLCVQYKSKGCDLNPNKVMWDAQDLCICKDPSKDCDDKPASKPMTKEEEEVLYGLANDWGEYLEINAFGIHQSMQNKEIYLSNDLLKIIVFNEKYKLDHKIGFGQLSDFLEKHEITWGHITGMRKVMKNYYDVLENYKNRKP